jgi:hypothetical protein
MARSLGAEDPRTEQQRRSDLFADLLLGRLAFDSDRDAEASDSEDSEPREAVHTEWLEVENIDPDTGELLGTQLQPLNARGEPVGEPVDTDTATGPGRTPRPVRHLRQQRIGVVVLASLIGASDTAAELADRSGFIPGEALKEQIAAALEADRGDEILFTRLLTDNQGRLLDTTELGRYPSARLAQAIKIRAGTCRYPTCTVPAGSCDLDHHEPVPKGQHIRQKHGSVLPPTPPRQDLRLARLHQRRQRRRLDHAHRRPLPMPGRTTPHRTSSLSSAAN